MREPPDPGCEENRYRGQQIALLQKKAAKLGLQIVDAQPA